MGTPHRLSPGRRIEHPTLPARKLATNGGGAVDVAATLRGSMAGRYRAIPA